MNRKLRGILGLVYGMSMIASSSNYKEENSRQYMPPENPKKVIPKGCQEFNFKYGNNKIYTCIARTQKAADEKFRRFLKTNFGT